MENRLCFFTAGKKCDGFVQVDDAHASQKWNPVLGSRHAQKKSCLPKVGLFWDQGMRKRLLPVRPE